LVSVILSVAKNQLAIDTVELERPSPFFVILNPSTTLRVNSVKNLVPQHPNTTFLLVTQYQKKAVIRR
jgi:hypothetical protein